MREPGAALLAILGAAVMLVGAAAQTTWPHGRDPEALPFAPRQYVCYRTSMPLTIDGRLDESDWRAAPWTEAFVDIQDGTRPQPRQLTRAKMLWDDKGFYVAAELEEADLWATLKERDSVIFRDNDFEIFLDPDGDTHTYYELEVNALGTEWDLMLVRPYRDGGPAIDAWTLAGLRTAVHLRGTLNRPGDRDDGWTVEVAMPWRSLVETAPQKKRPAPGDQWRVNLARVQWRLAASRSDASGYEKLRDGATSSPLPEDNWVWSPQGLIDMHMPERWGYVQFAAARAGERDEPFVPDPHEPVRWALRTLYYRQRAFREAQGRYATAAGALRAGDLHLRSLIIDAVRDRYEIRAASAAGATVHLREDGRVWVQGPGVRSPRGR